MQGFIFRRKCYTISIEWQLFKKKFQIFNLKSADWRTIFDVDKKKKRIKELEKEIQEPDFWKEREKAIKISQELAVLKSDIDKFDDLEIELEELKEKLNETKLQEFEKKLKEKELEIFLSGKYDRGDVILSIYAGAGDRTPKTGQQYY